MSISKFALIAVLVLVVFTSTIHAQTPTATQPGSVSSVTGTVTSEGTVRMIAHGESLQIRMEVYSASGDLVSDSGLRPGSIIDWKQTDATQPMPDGSYLVVITVKDFKGNLNQRMAALSLQAGQLLLQQQKRKRAEDALRDSEVHFRSVSESASDAFITVDEKSSIISVNPAAERIFGYSTVELTGAPLTMLMPEYIRHLHRAGIDRYITTNQKHISWLAVQLPGLHKNGHEIPLEISFCEWTRKGTRYFTGIVRDVTERKQAQEALRRTREERLCELERVRTRIAADLHDDIGSSLTKIVILSDVAQNTSENGAQKESLDAISEISNELVEAMSDIVWAINPKKDQLSELSHRMRRFASDMFTARNIKFHFRTQFEEDLQLGANVRREMFLIFKEGVNNVVKHSQCTEAAAQFFIEDDRLMLQVKDNGQGFEQGAQNEVAAAVGVGNGLPSMRQRVNELGGEFKLITARGEGTTIWVSVPLAGLNEK